MTQEDTRKKNLKVPTSEEARKNGRKGGIASGKVRAAQKPFKAMAKAIDQADREKVLEALLACAEDGSIPHIELLLKLMGEHPSQDAELTSNDSINVTIKGGDGYAD